MLKGEQSNTSIVYGDRLILKFFRRVGEGLNPDVEVGRFITDKTSFANVPALAGFLEIRKEQTEPGTLGILQGLVVNQGDAWRYTLDSLGRYFEEVLSRHPASEASVIPEQPLAELATQETPPLARELMGSYLSSAPAAGSTHRRTPQGPGLGWERSRLCSGTVHGAVSSLALSKLSHHCRSVAFPAAKTAAGIGGRNSAGCGKNSPA